jgi:flagellar basal-body rod protein FlgF
MQSGLYVALSAQAALEKRMDTIAHNVANSSTAGFRAEEVRFEALVSDVAAQHTAFASPGDSFFLRQPGPVSQTGNPLDIAVKGDAWFALQTPAGLVYTRDGRLRLTPEGELQSLTGYPITDAGGAPVQLNPAGPELQIAQDGTITQGGQRVGAIGLFEMAEEAQLTRFKSSGVVPNLPAIPLAEFSSAGVIQGAIEGANVNPVSEISKLVLVSRSFDALAAALETSESSFRDAIRTLGGG